MQEEEDQKRVEDALNALSEHFDTVQIFCSRHEAGTEGTIGVARGCGHWFARVGQISLWLTQMDEHARCQEREP